MRLVTTVAIAAAIGCGARSNGDKPPANESAEVDIVADSPDEFVSSSSPTSLLDEKFGYTKLGDFDVLAHADGRAVLIIVTSGDATGMLEKEALESVTSLGAQLKVNLTDVSEPRAVTGVAGVKVWVASAEGPKKKPIVAGAIHCKAAQVSYLLLGFSDAVASEAELESMVTKIGCPGAGKAITDRATACDVGAAAFCLRP